MSIKRQDKQSKASKSQEAKQEKKSRDSLFEGIPDERLLDVLSDHEHYSLWLYAKGFIKSEIYKRRTKRIRTGDRGGTRKFPILIFNLNIAGGICEDSAARIKISRFVINEYDRQKSFEKLAF